MATAYEPLPTTGDPDIDRRIVTANNLIESSVFDNLPGINEFDAALEGKYGIAAQEAAEIEQRGIKDFEDSLSKAREAIEALATGSKQNRRWAEDSRARAEARAELVARLDDIAERAAEV